MNKQQIREKYDARNALFEIREQAQTHPNDLDACRIAAPILAFLLAFIALLATWLR